MVFALPTAQTSLSLSFVHVCRDSEKDFLESSLRAERESKQHLQRTHHQERQQLWVLWGRGGEGRVQWEGGGEGH